MKKILFTLIALVMLSPVAFAGDFDYGQKDGFYCHSASCNIVYSKDASLIGDYENRYALESSQWYVRKAVDRKRLVTPRYWFRVNEMVKLQK